MIHSLKRIKNLKGKRILVRVDFNVPMKNGKILDDSRIQSSLKTIEFLTRKGAKVILLSHLGRPSGKVVPELLLKPVAKRLSVLLKKSVKVVSLTNLTPARIASQSDAGGLPSPQPALLRKAMQAGTRRRVLSSMKNGDVCMLENIRFHAGEENNDPEFSKALSGLGDIFVLDGFAVAHRASPSVSGVGKYIPAYAGFLLEKEIFGLDAVMKHPKKPAVLILGGAKIETKLPVLLHMIRKVDRILVGGAMVNTYLDMKGYGVGASLTDKGMDKHMVLPLFSKKKIIKPVDCVVGDKEGKRIRVVEIQKNPHAICAPQEMILDIGPETLKQFCAQIQKAKTLIWNGAMGYFEVPVYATGTFEMVRALAKCSKKGAYSVVGGGESVLILEKLKLTKFIDLISTGGGAMLEYLSGKKLPGVEGVKK